MQTSNTKWKEYEWLITNIYHDKLSSHDAFVVFDRKIKGRISGRLRQTDIAVYKNGKLKTIIDCKLRRRRKVGIKTVEEFLGLLDDTDANSGIIVSTLGFTEGAEKRVSNLNNVSLETVDWESAYEEYVSDLVPNYIPTTCLICSPARVSESIPSKIFWGAPFMRFANGLFSMFWLGKCVKCKNIHLWCDPCGYTSIIKGDRIICSICKVDYGSLKDVER